MKHLLFVALLLLAAPLHAEIDVMLDAAEAEAALAIADEIAVKGVATGASWNALFATNGYRDLQARERAMKRAFTDDDFKTFVTTDAVKRRAELRRALDEWKRLDVMKAAERAMRYLPAKSSIAATIYPLIKPRPNSFVFNTERGKAIFLNLDPAVHTAQFENIVVHEMHHIGFDSSCTEKSDMSTPIGRAHRFLGGFGEGFAVLAAAGSATTHPHTASPEDQRATWDRDVKHVAEDMKHLETLFLDLASGRLETMEEIQPRFMALIATETSPQGAFYTVGWHMASTIENARGREALVALMCNRVAMMRAYNEIVANVATQPKWSEEVLKVLSK